MICLDAWMLLILGGVVALVIFLINREYHSMYAGHQAALRRIAGLVEENTRLRQELES